MFCFKIYFPVNFVVNIISMHEISLSKNQLKQPLTSFCGKFYF